MIWMNPGKEKGIDIICDKQNQYYIWGAGQTGINFLKAWGRDITILGIIDSSEALIGQNVEGFCVQSPKNISFDSDIKIIITINTPQNIYEVAEFLKKQGMIENKNFFRYRTIKRVLNYWLKDKIWLEQTDISLTTKCTLRCKECLLQMPYIGCPVNLEWDEIKNRIDCSFRLVDEYEEYHIVGGEVLLSPELIRCIEYLGEQYAHQIQTIVMVTNATIEPQDSLLYILKKYNVQVEMSDYSYSKAFNGKQRLDLWVERLEKYGIKYAIRKMEMWNHFDREMKENYNERALTYCFDYCSCVVSTVSYVKDRVYLCARAAVAEDSGLSVLHEDNSFAIGDRTAENRRKFLEYVVGYTAKGYLEECKKCYCSTLWWENEIPAAEQLER